MRDVFDATLHIDVTDPTPRHTQIQRLLREMITSGRLQPGDKIPAESRIADSMGVSRMTVNKAILALTSEGLIVREVGRGTFIADRQTESEIVTLATLEAVPTRHRITLSFPHGAKNMLDSDYYGTIYRGVADLFDEISGTRSPAADLELASLAADDYVAEDQRAPADGWLIIAPRAETIPSIERLYASGRPLVVVGATWPGMTVPSVDSDNIDGAQNATRQLISEGHRRIALLYVEPETANTRDRITGYRRALAEAGLPHDPALEICADRVWQAGPAAKARIAALTSGAEAGPGERVTAVFAAGYYLALETMNSVRDAGLKVPEQVSVVGFDDPLSAHLVYPPLTTVRQPLYEMGRHAARRLLNLVQGTSDPGNLHEALPAPLIVRRSTAPVQP